MISKDKKIYALQFKVRDDFLENLERVLNFSRKCIKHSIICTSDLSLTGFAFDRLEEASEFSQYAMEKYLECIDNERTLITSIIEKKEGKFYNNIKVIKDHKVLYSQAKTQAFPLINEAQYMAQGKIEDINFFYIDGIKCAAINCFELRFIDIWKKIQGAEIIFVLAQWDKERKRHFEILSQALAITNQSFVVASDWANEGSSKGSSIISPYGKVYRDGKRGVIYANIKFDEILEMRKHINVGLN